MSRSIGIIGARGHVGIELMRLIAGHPEFALGFACSRELAGQTVVDPTGSLGHVRYSPPDHALHGVLQADAVVLALPNGMAAAYVATFDKADAATVLLPD